MLEFIRHDLEKYLLHTFGYPSANIRFIDWGYLDLLHASATTHKTLLPEQVEVFGWVENFLRTFRGDLAGMFNRVALVAAALGKKLQKDKKGQSRSASR